jgi:hypothetical protein
MAGQMMSLEVRRRVVIAGQCRLGARRLHPLQLIVGQPEMTRHSGWLAVLYSRPLS